MDMSNMYGTGVNSTHFNPTGTFNVNKVWEIFNQQTPGPTTSTPSGLAMQGSTPSIMSTRSTLNTPLTDIALNQGTGPLAEGSSLPKINNMGSDGLWGIANEDWKTGLGLAGLGIGAISSIASYDLMNRDLKDRMDTSAANREYLAAQKEDLKDRIQARRDTRAWLAGGQ
jgi:hypothetical protein